MSDQNQDAPFIMNSDMPMFAGRRPSWIKRDSDVPGPVLKLMSEAYPKFEARNKKEDK